MGILRNAAVGLLLLTSGCSSARVGFGYRSVGLESAPFDVRETIPLVGFEARKKLAEGFECGIRFDCIAGEKCTTQNHLEGSAQGEFYSVGIGASYYPFGENFSLDLGGEIFYADVDRIRGRFGLIGNQFGDSVLGGGINVGATGRIPLGKNANFIFSGRYNITDNAGNSGDATYNFDGAQVFLGLEVKFH
jgi:hypothetical protein